MMNYYNTHLTKTADAKPITKKKLERGMVVKIRYKKAEVYENYMVLVLQPRWEGKLHALSFNVISPQKVLIIAKNNHEILAESTRVRKLNLAKIRVKDASKLFYTSEIKSDNNLKAGYRTFNLDKIQSITVVNYNWGKYDRIPPESERT
tara:strand:- start:12 stop:458 length:447 start_codon:yes stop_codon:yes gene_type:complete